MLGNNQVLLLVVIVGIVLVYYCDTRERFSDIETAYKVSDVMREQISQNPEVVGNKVRGLIDESVVNASSVNLLSNIVAVETGELNTDYGKTSLSNEPEFPDYGKTALSNEPEFPDYAEP